MEELLERLYNGEREFTEEERADFVWETDRIGKDQGQEGRWTRFVTVYFKYKGKYFGISYEEGLTEYQENSFDYNPFEVKPYEETITITRYKVIDYGTYTPIR